MGRLFDLDVVKNRLIWSGWKNSVFLHFHLETCHLCLLDSVIANSLVLAIVIKPCRAPFVLVMIRLALTGGLICPQ